MFRFISLLLILAGLGALAFGGYQYFQPEQSPAKRSASSPAGSTGFDAPSEPVVARSTPSPEASDDDFFGIASVEDDFMRSLRTVPVAHETPKTAVFGRAFTVTLALEGSCASCALVPLTLKGAIEPRLRTHSPWITDVRTQTGS